MRAAMQNPGLRAVYGRHDCVYSYGWIEKVDAYGYIGMAGCCAVDPDVDAAFSRTTQMA